MHTEMHHCIHIPGDQVSHHSVLLLVTSVVGIVTETVPSSHHSTQEEEKGEVEVVQAVGVVAHCVVVEGQVLAPPLSGSREGILLGLVQVLACNVNRDRRSETHHQPTDQYRVMLFKNSLITAVPVKNTLL